MTRLRAVLVFLLAFWVSGAAQAVTLDGAAPASGLHPSLTFHLDASGQLSVDQAEALPDSAFAAVMPNTAFLIGSGALWLRFNATNNQSDDHWHLVLELPGLDNAQLYFRKHDGQWMTQQAGDSRAISGWTQPARYPVFSLSHKQGKQVSYFVRIEHHRVPYSVMPRIVTDSQLFNTELASHMLLGAYFGLAALVVVLALANTLAYRDAGFGTYALYIAMFMLSQSMFTGVAGLYWWPEWPLLNQGLTFAFVLAVAAATWFVRTVVVPKRFSSRP